MVVEVTTTMAPGFTTASAPCSPSNTSGMSSDMVSWITTSAPVAASATEPATLAPASFASLQALGQLVVGNDLEICFHQVWDHFCAHVTDADYCYSHRSHSLRW
nr:hypothetical protein [Propionibacterium freudenreichii]